MLFTPNSLLCLRLRNSSPTSPPPPPLLTPSASHSDTHNSGFVCAIFCFFCISFYHSFPRFSSCLSTQSLRGLYVHVDSMYMWTLCTCGLYVHVGCTQFVYRGSFRYAALSFLRFASCLFINLYSQYDSIYVWGCSNSSSQYGCI